MKKVFALMLTAALALSACTPNEPTAGGEDDSALEDAIENFEDMVDDLDEDSEPARPAVSPDEWAIEFEGQRVPVGDFQFALGYLQLMQVFGELPDGIDPYEQSLINLKDILLLEAAAQRHDVDLPDDMYEDFEFMVEEILEMMPMLGMDTPQISNRRASEIMALETLKQEVAPFYTGNVVINQQELDAAEENFLTNHRREFTEANMRFIVAETEENAAAYHAEITAAAPGEINAIIRRLIEAEIEEMGDEPLDDDWGTPTAEMEDMRMWIDMGLLTPPDVEAITHMSVGDITAPIEILGGGYAIFIIDSIEVDDNEDRIEEFRETFRQERQAEAFEEVLEGWRAESEFVLNQPIIDAVTQQ